MFFTVASLVAGAAAAAAKAGGAIKAAKTLRSAESPESVYAKRYREAFGRDMNASIGAQMAGAGAANTPAGQVAAQRAIISNLGNEAGVAGRSATNDARAYTNMYLQGVNQDANAARQTGDAVGGLLGSVSDTSGGIGSMQDKLSALSVAEDRNRRETWGKEINAGQSAGEAALLSQRATGFGGTMAGASAPPAPLPAAMGARISSSQPLGGGPAPLGSQEAGSFTRKPRPSGYPGLDPLGGGWD